MKKKIENPKVFISYAWGSEEYQNKVLAFVSQLRSDGIDTVFDKWDLIEGNDTYAFMEKCVTDPSVTNVLMLLDPIYAKKADDHSGGVGTETQIISAKIYQEVTQDKFIPVVMERDEDGSICKPTYLQGRLHFDLSIADDYDNTYQRLVKTLYGEEIYAKPELGKKPSWVDKPIVIPPRSVVTYDSLKSMQIDKVRKTSFVGFLDDISGRMVDFAQQHKNLNNEEYLDIYESTESIKIDFLLLLGNSSYVDDSYKTVANFLEETVNALSNDNTIGNEIIEVFIHELFIYTIAYFIRNRDYSAAGYILGKTYFNQRPYYNNSNVDGFHMFYSGSKHQNLDDAVCERDNQKYHSGTARYWTQNVSAEFCSKEQYVLADLICFNYSVYGKDYIADWPWFPVTYIYDNEYNSSLAAFTKKMISREYMQEVLPLFGYDEINDFITKFKSVEETSKNEYRNYRYPESFRTAHLLRDFIKAEQIASLR